MTFNSSIPRVSLVLALCVLAGGVLGQPATQPPRLPGNDPILNDPGIERELRTRERTSEPVMPTPVKPPQQAIPTVPAPVAEAPGLGGIDFSLPRRQRYPEGTFISTTPGQVIKARTGDVIFVPDTRGGAQPEPPMVLMRSQKLSQIEAAMGSPGFTGRATVGGQVFVYRNRHYLLPTVFATMLPEESKAAQPAQDVAPAAAETPTPAKQPESERPAVPTQDPANDPRVEDLIKDLEAQRSVPRALTPNPSTEPPPSATANTTPAVAPVADAAAEPKALTPEGTMLVFRRGRLVRLSEEGGRIAFAFDNDPNSPAPAPMIIQPSAQLQRLEGLAAVRGDAMTLKASGRVLTYQGRNYLLPTFVQVVTTGEVVPMQ